MVLGGAAFSRRMIELFAAPGNRGRSLKSQLAQSGVVGGSRTEGPVVLAICGSDGQIIDAGDPDAHQAPLVELPVLIAVGAEVLTAVVMPLVGEAYCDPVAVECPDLLDEAVVQLACPLAAQEGDDLGPAVDELSP